MPHRYGDWAPVLGFAMAHEACDFFDQEEPALVERIGAPDQDVDDLCHGIRQATGTTRFSAWYTAEFVLIASLGRDGDRWIFDLDQQFRR